MASLGFTLAPSCAAVCDRAVPLPVVTAGAGSVAAKALPASSTATQKPAETHDTPVSAARPGPTAVDAHVGRLAVGLSLSNAVPAGSSTTHRPTSLHDTAESEPSGSTAVADHVTGAATTLAVAYTRPSLATATHNADALHDTAVKAVLLVNGVICHDDMLVGFVDTRTSPPSSTAAHSEMVGHEIAVRWCTPSTGMGRDHVIGSPALVDARTLPARSTATQSETEGHEIPLSGVIMSMFSGVQFETRFGGAP
jgi:hypothetical protein